LGTTPPTSKYYDYDFKNAEAYDLLEDLFYETTYSAYNHLDNLNSQAGLPTFSVPTPYFSTRESFFEKGGLVNELQQDPFCSYLQGSKGTPRVGLDSFLRRGFYSNTCLFDEGFQPLPLAPTTDFGFINLTGSLFALDESYET